MSRNQEPSKDESHKRKRTDSNTSAENPCPSWAVASSPPKFVSLEDLMNAAVGLDKMALVHEISVDPYFRIQKSPKANCSDTEVLTPSSPFKNLRELESTVKRMVHRAFWDSLRTDLAKDPPCYDRALLLLEDVKQIILSLLLPHHEKLKSEIEERIDLQLVRQQCEKGCFDFIPLAQYILDTMAKLCAPVRDDAIRQLRNCTDLFKLYKGVFDVLNDMKLDMANYSIKSMRPVMQQHGVEYERQKFNDYLKINPDGLAHTREWLVKAVQDMQSNNRTLTVAKKVLDGPSTSYKNEGLYEAPIIKLDYVLIEACWNLLEWPDERYDSLPETFVVDEVRLRQMRYACLRLILLVSVVVTVVNFGGKDFADANSFKTELKDKLLILMQDLQPNDDKLTYLSSYNCEKLRNIPKCLSMISEQVCACFEKFAKAIGSHHEGKSELLKVQIIGLADTNNPVRRLLRDRLKTFIVSACKPKIGQAMQIPVGLNIVSKELAQLTGTFLRLFVHNAQVFAEHYEKILAEILKDKSSSDSKSSCFEPLPDT